MSCVPVLAKHLSGYLILLILEKKIFKIGINLPMLHGESVGLKNHFAKKYVGTTVGFKTVDAL